ncbi:sensor histidine kinase [Sulfoacidibacillus thermotolerans]|uniref:histidine kinase n=1 Tax=Sulfoacidibacillus thermotolerans TaxID=1765684 RepID=A0A2U3D7R1_SULT2|nr:ATP-binding protein [Sulfoacidibacillus thermotolerans]PWI57302.1 hypothetical protein BM613_09405 [Sulfoacidibacillus thermotolerans]
MFQRVGLRLAILNAVVFACILFVIAGTLYLFTKERLYAGVDHALRTTAQIVLHRAEQANRHRHEPSATVRLPVDHAHFGQVPTLFLVWTRGHQIWSQEPENTFSTSDLKLLAAALEAKRPVTLTIQNHTFRVLNLPVPMSAGALPSGGTMQVIRNIDDQVHELQNLLFLILFDLLAGLFAAVVAGWFLASRALIPIRRSWEKQQQFVSDASHELRTPLAVVQAQAQLLLRHPTHTVEQEAGSISAIDNEARRMNQLVDDLLTLARADSKQLELSLQSVRCSELLQRIADLYQLLCEQKGLKVSFVVEPEIVLQADEKRLLQLIWILLDNALKYTPKGGSVLVECHADEGHVELSVSDTGMGIAKQDLPHIFDRFYRGDKSRATGGTGLGLAIGKWIVDAHHGKMIVQSEVHRGTMCRVFFPRGKS